MRIVVTGSTSGVGQGLVKKLLDLGHTVIPLSRVDVDLANIEQVQCYELQPCEMLINCAGTGIGGKTDFITHNLRNITDILNVNFVAPVTLTHKALSSNRLCKIVNVTSTNNNRYWPNDLAYSLSKKAFEDFGNMLTVEYPDVSFLEVRLGLTKTNFNQNRYSNDPNRFVDIYATNKHLSVDYVVDQITSVLFNNNIKFIEIAP